jgi:hypothetical protein
MSMLMTVVHDHVHAGVYILEKTRGERAGNISRCYLGEKYEKGKRIRGKMQDKKEEK